MASSKWKSRKSYLARFTQRLHKPAMAKINSAALGIILASPFALTGTAFAQETEGTSPYAKCAEIADDMGRLACFDATFAGETTRVAEEKAEREQQAQEQFGLTPAQVRARAEAAGEKVPEADDGQVTAAILEVYIESRSKLRRFLLDNGQLWAEATGSTTMRRGPRAGQTATIKAGPLGSFQLRVEGKRGFVRVKRLR